MDRQKRRRSTVPRLLGMALIAIAYLATLTWASDISAVGAASSARDVVVTAASGAVSQGNAAAEATARSIAGPPTEAPVTTLGIAGALLALLGVAYLLRSLRDRTLVARRARLMVRYITTLI